MSITESRLNLDAELANVLASVNKPQNLYFQPPESIRLKYPCIIYERSGGHTRFADNRPYFFEERYKITVIDRDPDNPTVRAIAMHFPKNHYDQHFVHDNLHHDVFTIYWHRNSKEE